MAELSQSQLEEFNGQTGFIIKFINDTRQTKMMFDGHEFLMGNRYPLNMPSKSGVPLDQRGGNPIFHYISGETFDYVNGALRYRIYFEETGLSMYLYLGYSNHADGNHGFYVSMLENSSGSELRRAVREANTTGNEHYPFHGKWMAHVEYMNYGYSVKVQQINVTFSKMS